MAIRFTYLKHAGISIYDSILKDLASLNPSYTYFRRMILVKDLENSFMTRNNRCKFRLNVASKADDIKSLYIRTSKISFDLYISPFKSPFLPYIFVRQRCC